MVVRRACDGRRCALSMNANDAATERRRRD
jgi:hypothetical protein